MSTFYRVGTANMYDSTLRNLSARQTSLMNQQENLTSGKRVVRASDDPVAAAQAERALTRISRIQSEQRALENQKNSIAQAESTIGQAVDIVQELRQLVVSAGNGSLTSDNRKTIATQIQSLREQLTDMVNRKDTNGVPLLSALGSALSPFLGPTGADPDYLFSGQPGQAASTGVGIATTLDGESAFMFDPQRDGAYTIGVSDIPSGRTLSTTAATPTNVSQVTGDAYQIVFSGVGPGATAGTTTATYTITNTTTGVSSPAVTVPDFPSDKATSITIAGVPGLTFNVTGTPADGDTLTMQPSTSIFSSIDTAITGITQASNSSAAGQVITQALANIDMGLTRMQSMRSYAGELLNRADRISGDQDNRSIQLEADRSRAEDLDMTKGISDFQNTQVGYQAALQSYAMVQKLSLFNYIG